MSSAAFLLGAAVLAASLAGMARAQNVLPAGGVVAAGAAAIAQTAPNSLTVTQSSANAIVNWTSFSIGAGNSVRFENGAGATLNRVTGFSRSQIDGALSASGSLYLVNPNGITVGPTGSVTTGGSFVASTHDVSDADFLAGGAMTFRGSSKASVINYGAIGSLGGDVALIARKVENTGSVTAPAGTAALVAGYEVLMRDGALSDGKFVVKVGGSDTEAKTSGVIKAAEVELKASGGNVYALAGNTASLTKATGIANKGGRIFLTAGAGGTAKVDQKMVARGASSGGKAKGGEIRVSGGTVKISSRLDAKGDWEKGGTIVVTGRDIALAAGADLDVSGTEGGVLLVGGDFQGGKDATTKYLTESVTTAETATVEAGAVLRADGSVGAGGKVVVWSDRLTRFSGAISATGVTAGGDAEVSGKAVLAYDGTADLRASDGRFGTLLLDPYDITISTAPDSQVDTSDPTSPFPTGDNSILNVTTLTDALATSNVTVTTGSGGDQAGDITVLAPIIWSADTLLLLSSEGSIYVNAPITATGANAGLTLQYATHGASGALYQANAPITLSGANAQLQIGRIGSLVTYTLLRSMAEIDAIDTTGLSGAYALVADLDASGTTYAGSLVSGAFSGMFAGLGHTISGLTISAPSTNNVGLFAELAAASIQDLNFAGGSIAGGQYVGALAGLGQATLSNIASSASVSGATDVGGLIGLNYFSTVTGLSSSGTVTGTGARVGGIIGSVNESTITFSYATGAVSGASSVGGLVGSANGNISKSYATGDVTGTGDSVGGLAGVNGVSITDSYASGAVQGGTNVGGLLGQNFGGVHYSYAIGSVTGTSSVGGLIGYLNESTLTNSYASGAVTGVSQTGGLVGRDRNGYIESSYWDKDSTGQGASGGSTSDFGLTSAQARTQGAYSDWDFDNTWYQSGDLRPMGRWEAARGAGSVSLVNNLHQVQLMQTRLDYSYVLTADIDAGATAASATSPGIWGASGFQPIASESDKFWGSFDGRNHAITGLTITRTVDEAGLFGAIEEATVVKNLVLTGGTVTGTSHVGALVGKNYGIVENVHSSVDVTGAEYEIGGLVGRSEGTISNSSASGTVSSQQDKTGGLVGYAGGTITDSFATGAVTGAIADPGYYNTGGLVGYSSATITGSYATGAVSGGGYVGGLAGTNANFITSSYATGSVSGNGVVGGLVGGSEGAIDVSYATGAVSAIQDAAGGLVGRATGGSVSNSYAMGTVTSDGNTGGLIGDNRVTVSGSHAAGAVTGTAAVGGLIGTNTENVSNSYASGAVTGTSSVGGLIGWLEADGRTISGTSATGAVTLTGTGNYAGGLIGYSLFVASIVDSSATGAVTSGGNYVGGLVGRLEEDGEISRSYASGTVSGANTVGGLVGATDGIITDSFALGSVAATSGKAGGLVGESLGSLLRVYAAGATTGGTGTAGGLVGYNDGAIQNSYWDSASTGSSDAAGEVSDNSNIINVISVSASNRYAQATYGNFNFTTTWYMADGKMRPLLRTTNTTITNVYQLQLMETDRTAAYTIGADFDAAATFGGGASLWSSAGFVPVGRLGAVFTGSLAGGGYTISGLTIASSETSNTGLFGWLSATATVSDLTLANVSVSGVGSVGALVGRNVGTLTNVRVSGTVSGTGENVGGLVGTNFASGIISQAIVSANVTGQLARVGGLVGDNAGSISDAAATGTVAGGAYVGGLVGYNSGTVTQSYASGNVTATNHAGGLVGQHLGTISESFAIGNATVVNGGAGGLVGYSEGTISTAYATGAATGTTNVGGLIGAMTAGTVSQAYATGLVTTGGNTGTGGLIGTLTAASSSVTTSYWDTETSEAAASPAGTGLTTAQMQVWSNYAGWDADIWAPAQADAGATYLPQLYGVSGVVAVEQAMVYGDDPATAAVSYIGTGFWNTVTGTPVTTLSATTNAGQSYTEVSGLTGITPTGGATRFVGRAAVTPRALTVTAVGQSRAYGDDNPVSGTASAPNLVNGDTISSVTVASTATAASNVGSYNLLASAAVFGTGLATNYLITYADAATGLSVTQAALTVTANNDTMIYGDDAPTAIGYVATGWKNSQSDSLLTGVTVTTDANSASNVGSSYVTTAAGGTLTGDAAGNYALTYVQGTMSVTARALTVTAVGQSRAYGDDNPTSGTALAPNLVNGDTISSVTVTSSATATSNVGSYNLLASAAVFGAGSASNYAITYADAATGLSVTQRALTVTAVGQSRAYGDDNPTSGTALAPNLVNGDTITSVTVTSSATGTSNVGSYNLLASDAVFGAGSASNYAITYADAATGLSVTQRALTVTAVGQSRAYGDDNPVSGTALAPDLVNGDTITSVTVTSSATATSNVGSYNLLASDAVFGAGSASNYAITYADAATGLSVTQRALTVTAVGQSRAYGDDNPTSGTALAPNLVNGDTITSVTV
ncbi:MBG domain-containing protein, partial [Aquabacter spiritensis]